MSERDPDDVKPEEPEATEQAGAPKPERSADAAAPSEPAPGEESKAAAGRASKPAVKPSVMTSRSAAAATAASTETAKTAKGADSAADPPAEQGEPEENLPGLMAEGAAGRPGPDLDEEALRAAEEALRQGHRALAEARAHLQDRAAGPNRREQVLRALLVVNLLLMVAVMLIPSPEGPAPEPSVPPIESEQRNSPQAADDPYLRALEAANRRDYATALKGLDEYVASSPRLSPGRLMLVHQAQAYYASMLGEQSRAASYERKAAALMQSHTLPEDLLEMAKNAEQRGDAAAMRRTYARFLLQQRQIPASLYKHVAEAYLKLGDSYRKAAENGAEAERKKELQRRREDLREKDGKEERR